MAEARALLIFDVGDTGLAIGDLTFNFIKTIDDGTTVSAANSTLVDLGRGYYTLMNPNITEDTIFSVYPTAQSTKVREGIFTLYSDVAVAVRDVDNSAPAAGSLGEDLYRANIGANSYLPNIYTRQGDELTSVVCTARWSGVGVLQLWGYSDNAGYGSGIILGTISGDGTYTSNGAASAHSSSFSFEWSGVAPTGVTIGDLTVTNPYTGAIYVWKGIDPTILSAAGNGILGADGSIYQWPAFDGLAMISPAPSVDPFVRNKLNSLPLTMLNRFVTATSWVKADFTATTTSVITGDALLEVWGYNLVESTSEPNIGGYTLGQTIMLGSFDSTGVWTFGVDWTEPSISRDIIEIYAGGGSTGSISTGKLTISTKRYGNPDNNYEVFVTKVPAVSTGGGDGGYIMVDGSLSYQTGTGTRFASVSQSVLDTTSIAEAVRDVDNSTPAVGSLGESINLVPTGVRDVAVASAGAGTLGRAVANAAGNAQLTLFNAYGWSITAGNPSTGSFDQTLPVGAVMYFSVQSGAGMVRSFGEYNGTWTSSNLDTWDDVANTIILDVDFEVGDTIPAGTFTITVPQTIVGGETGASRTFTLQIPTIYGIQDGSWEHTPTILFRADGSPLANTATGADPQAIAEAVRDVDNSAPAAGSLGEAANGGLAAYEMSRVVGMQVLGQDLLGLAAAHQIDVAFSGTITGNGSFRLWAHEITASASHNPNSGSISLSEQTGTLIGTYNSTGWNPESIGNLYKAYLFMRPTSTDGVSSGVFTITIWDGLGSVDYKIPYDNTGADFYVWLGGDGKLIGYGGSGPNASLHQPVRLPTYPETDTAAIAAAVRDVDNTNPAPNSLGEGLVHIDEKVHNIGVQQLVRDFIGVADWLYGTVTASYSGTLTGPTARIYIFASKVGWNGTAAYFTIAETEPLGYIDQTGWHYDPAWTTGSKSGGILEAYASPGTGSFVGKGIVTLNVSAWGDTIYPHTYTWEFKQDTNESGQIGGLIRADGAIAGSMADNLNPVQYNIIEQPSGVDTAAISKAVSMDGITKDMLGLHGYGPWATGIAAPAALDGDQVIELWESAFVDGVFTPKHIKIGELTATGWTVTHPDQWTWKDVLTVYIEFQPNTAGMYPTGVYSLSWIDKLGYHPDRITFIKEDAGSYNPPPWGFFPAVDGTMYMQAGTTPSGVPIYAKQGSAPAGVVSSVLSAGLALESTALDTNDNVHRTLDRVQANETLGIQDLTSVTASYSGIITGNAELRISYTQMGNQGFDYNGDVQLGYVGSGGYVDGGTANGVYAAAIIVSAFIGTGTISGGTLTIVLTDKQGTVTKKVEVDGAYADSFWAILGKHDGQILGWAGEDSLSPARTMFQTVRPPSGADAATIAIAVRDVDNSAPAVGSLGEDAATSANAIPSMETKINSSTAWAAGNLVSVADADFRDSNTDPAIIITTNPPLSGDEVVYLYAINSLNVSQFYILGTWDVDGWTKLYLGNNRLPQSWILNVAASGFLTAKSLRLQIVSGKANGFDQTYQYVALGSNGDLDGIPHKDGSIAIYEGGAVVVAPDADVSSVY